MSPSGHLLCPVCAWLANVQKYKLPSKSEAAGTACRDEQPWLEMYTWVSPANVSTVLFNARSLDEVTWRK